MSRLEVMRTGPLILLQDRGRRGLLGLGVSTSGAFDRIRADAANAAVGNADSAAVLELLLGGSRLRAEGQVTISVCGPAEASVVRGSSHEAEPVAECLPLALANGDELRLGAPSWGLRTYVAVAGGFEVEPVLGSLSRDQLSGLGPEPIRPGQSLEVGEGGLLPSQRGLLLVSRPPQPPERGAVIEVDFLPGPRTDWLDPGELGRLSTVTWQVSPRSDRTGIRLVGASLRARRGELPSEAALPGAIQLPPSGEPIIFGPDHPVTGGYPVVGVVTARALSALAQARPGYHVRLRPWRDTHTPLG